MADFTSRTGARALSFERQETLRLARALTAEDTGASSPLGPHAMRASTIDLTVHARTSAAGGSIELTAEHSDDGETWSTVGTIGTLELTGIVSATVEPTKEWLRVSWSAVESWSIDVTAVGHATEETRSAAALADLTDVDTDGGTDGDVLTQQNDGSFALETPSGGGVGTVSCLLEAFPLDIHDAGTHACLWSALFDNPKDFASLLAIPVGLGLTFAFDGTSAAVTTTEAGTWAFTLGFSVSTDATWTGVLQLDANVYAQTFVPTVAYGGTTPAAAVGVTLKVPAGYTLAPLVFTIDEATADPLNADVYLTIVRLA